MLNVCVKAVVLLGVPCVRQGVAAFIAGRLSQALNARLAVNGVSVKLLGHVVVSSMLLSSRSKGRVLGVAHLSTGFSVVPLFGKGVAVDDIRLFNFGVGLGGPTPRVRPGFGFILSTFTSGSAMGAGGSVSLHVGSVLVHHNGLSCSMLSRRRAPKGFGPRRVGLRGVVTGVSLGTLRGSSIGTTVGHLDMSRRSNFRLQGLDLGIVTGGGNVGVRGFTVRVPNARVGVSAVQVRCSDLGTLGRFTSGIHFSFHALPSRIALGSVSTFIPTLSGFGRGLSLGVSMRNALGRLGYEALRVGTKSGFQLGKSMSLRSLSHPRSTCICKRLTGLSTGGRKVKFLIHGLDPRCGNIPPMLRRLKGASFRNRVSKCFASLIVCNLFHASVNSIRASLGLDSSGTGTLFSCSKNMGAASFRLKRLLKGGRLNGVAFGLSIQKGRCGDRCPSVALGNLVTSLRCDGCGCRGVALSKRFGHNNFSNGITLGSRGNSMRLGNGVGMIRGIPAFGFGTIVSGVHPRSLGLAGRCPSTRFSLGLGTGFQNNSVSRVVNRVGVSDLRFATPRGDCFLSGVGVATAHRSGRGRLGLASDFLGTDVRNGCLCRALPTDIVGVVQQCVPSLVRPSGGPVEAGGGFDFSVRVFGARLLSAMFSVPLGVCSRSAIGNCFGSRTRHLHMRNCFPHLRCRGAFVRSNLMLYRGPASRFGTGIQFGGLGGRDTMDVSLSTRTGGSAVGTGVG